MWPTMNPFKLLYCLLLIVVLTIPFSGCDLFEDDEHCDFTRGEIETWQPGNFVDTYWVRDENNFDEGALYFASLGGNEFIHLTDVCTSQDVTISAEVQINPETWETYGALWKCYLVIKNGFIVGTSNVMAMARTNLEDNSLRIEPIKIPVSPSFETSLIEGTLDAWVVIRFPVGRYCEEEEAHSAASQTADFIVKKATITVEYTVY